jgi:hypothetical protein
MSATRTVINILRVLLRWAFRGEDGGNAAVNEEPDAPQGFPDLRSSVDPLDSAVPR